MVCGVALICVLRVLRCVGLAVCRVGLSWFGLVCVVACCCVCVVVLCVVSFRFVLVRLVACVVLCFALRCGAGALLCVVRRRCSYAGGDLFVLVLFVGFCLC